jgi:hypothetical protein
MKLGVRGTVAALAGLVAAIGPSVSCGGGSPDVADAAVDPAPEAGTPLSGDDAGPEPDGGAAHCTLGDGTEPVALCMQKSVLSALHAHAFDREAGVASSFSPASGMADEGDGGQRLHAWTDDVGYAAAVAFYLASEAFFASCSRDFQPLAPGASPYADSYRSAANVALIEGLNALLPLVY